MNASNTIKNRLSALRGRMREAGGDICLITDNDPHISEYTGDHYKVREFFSGFTGSAGTLVVCADNAWLFTDGRYFVQAGRELSGTGIELKRLGTKDTPTSVKFITQKTGEIAETQNRKGVVLTDGTLLSASDGIFLCDDKNTTLVHDFKPEEGIWTDRPTKPCSAVYALEERYCGEGAESKIRRIRDKMKEKEADVYITASLEDIAWTLNLRGSDIECTPVFESFLVFCDDIYLFAHENALSENVVNCLLEQGVNVKNYDTLYNCIGKIVAGKRVLADKRHINFELYAGVSRDKDRVIFADSPVMLMRAVKNEVEVGNTTDVHIEDGLCVTRLMYYVKNAAARGDRLTEEDAADYVDGLRSEISDHVMPSFPTISAYGANAAMMHYSTTPETAAELKAGKMLLVDSGGHYLRGTTDVTRTFALGQVSDEEKKAYTLVLKGVLALADVRFLQGTSGYGLDILARQFLWREGIDYRCGTGHGVGHLLNVHEGPNAFRYRYTPGVSDYCELQPGMITTDEPGVYEEGRFGIRIENELLCVPDHENEYGSFLRFKNLTLVPYDRDLIDTRLLTGYEKGLIDEYHGMIFDTFAPRLEGAELEFLRKYTAPLGEK